MNTQLAVKRVAQAVANMMLRDGNIEVTISGNQAYRQSGRINVPLGDFTDPDVVTMTHGYIDHEIGHERFTDSIDYSDFGRQSPLHAHIINIVEDVWMERSVGNELSGCKQNLRRLAELAVDKGLFTEPSEHMLPVEIVQSLVLYRGRHLVVGQQKLSAYSAQAEWLCRQMLGDEVTDELIRLTDAIANVHSTCEAVGIAEAIIQLLKSEEDNENDDDDSDDQDSDDSSNDDSESDEREPDGNGSGDSDSEGDDESQSAPNDETSNQQDQPSDESSATDNDAPQEANGDANDGGTSGSDSAKSSSPGTPSDADIKAALQAIINASSNDGLPDFHADLARELEAGAMESQDPLAGLAGAQTPPLAIVKQAALGNEFNTGMAARIGKRVFQKMSRVLIDEDDSLQIHRNSGSKVDARRLAGVASGNDRIFTRRIHQPDIKCAMSFLIDASYSMRDMMVDTNQIAYALCHGLSTTGISTEVLYFSVAASTRSGDSVYVAKSFNENRPIARKFTCRCNGGTPTGQAMVTALSRLSLRSEAKKMLFVVTDGQSNGAEKVMRAVEMAKHLGVIVVPIGIKTEKVDGFAADSFTSIMSVEELPHAIDFAIKQRLFK